MACLHILALKRVTDSQALYLCHGLQAHAFSDGVHDSLAHQPTLCQVLEPRNWTMLYSSIIPVV